MTWEAWATDPLARTNLARHLVGGNDKGLTSAWRGRGACLIYAVDTPVNKGRRRKLSRSDFMFTIGYRGSIAMVDRTACGRYQKLSCHKLLEHGLYKAALCGAEYDGNVEAQRTVLESYNAQAIVPVADVDQLRARFGVFGVPASVAGVERV